MSFVESAAAPARPAISTYWLDVACVGGASLLILVPTLLLPADAGLWQGASLVAALNLLINFPHFMASYRMVYRSRAEIWRYRRATLYVPAALLAWGALALAAAEENGVWVHLLVTFAGLYIGVHYTGQAWGMMAAFSSLEGHRFKDSERRLIRGGFVIMALWHAASNALTLQPPPSWLPLLDGVRLGLSSLVPVSFALSCVGLFLYSRRHGQVPPTRVWLPWISLYVWYAVFAGRADGAFWVQIAHSLQYLTFPARMELNRARDDNPPSRLREAARLAAWYLALVGVGYFVFHVLSSIIQGQIAALWFRGEAFRLVPIVVTAFVNIHHYYTDGCIWKMRDPEVRRDLFLHLRRALPQSASSPDDDKGNEGDVRREPQHGRE